MLEILDMSSRYVVMLKESSKNFKKYTVFISFILTFAFKYFDFNDLIVYFGWLLVYCCLIITFLNSFFIAVKLSGTESTSSSCESCLNFRLASAESSVTSRVKSGNTNDANGSAHWSVDASASKSQSHSWNPWPGLLDTRWHISAYVCALRPWSLSTSLLPVELATIFDYKYNGIRCSLWSSQSPPSVFTPQVWLIGIIMPHYAYFVYTRIWK